jgi:quercetin dioxygenase-like cupin family protein
MEIRRSGSQKSSKGRAEYFTGTVRIDPLFEAREYVVAGDRRIDREAAGEAASDRAITSQPADVRGASVAFEPSARTAWHTHPLGQTLIVTCGLGWVQRWGGPIGRLSRLLHWPVPRTSRANFQLRRRHPRPLARAISTKSLAKHRREASGAQSP